MNLKHIKLKQKCGEGEIPFESNTGTGPKLLILCFPYVRDWLNEHPFRNESDASFICRLVTGSPLNPETCGLWTMIRQLRKRILTLVDSKFLKDDKEIERIKHLIVTMIFSLYRIFRHDITNNSDHLL